jgi:spermidine/putrescine-binding protein
MARKGMLSPRGRWRSMAVAVAVVATASAAAWSSAGGAAPVSSRSATTTTLNVISWEGYTEAKWVKPFEQQNNVKLKITYVGSDDDLFSKIRGDGGRAFDLVAGSRANLGTFYDAGFIVPLDRSKLTNFKNVVAPIKPRTTVNGKLLAVPYVWGSIPLMYSKKVFPKPPTSWSVVYGNDPRTCGKVLLAEDAGTSIATAALYLGIKNPYKLTDAQFGQVKKVLLQAKKCAKAFYSGFGDAANYFASGEAVSGMSIGSLITKMAAERGASVAEVIPKEGAIGWVDTWMITKAGADKSALAYKWLNYMQSPKIQLDVSKQTNFAPTIAGVAGKLDAGIRKTLHLDDPTYLQRLVPQEAPQAPDSWDKRLKLWNTIRGE